MNLSLFTNGINLMSQHLYLSEIAKRTSGNPQRTKQPETITRKEEIGLCIVSVVLKAVLGHLHT
jgi:hypothetical protein